MFNIFDAILNVYNEILIGIIEFCLKIMFEDLNKSVELLTAMAVAGPTNIFPEILEMINKLSDEVMLPIASIILSFVLTYDLISMVIDKNNMRDFDTSIFFRFFFKAVVCVLLLVRCKEITLAIFDVGAYIAQKAGDTILSVTDMSISDALVDAYVNGLSTISTNELYVTSTYCVISFIIFKIIAVLVAVIAYGRIVEIYIMISVAPITFATLGNKEWGHIGTTYIKGLLALAFQGFFMLVCVAIYSAILASAPESPNVMHTMVESIIFGVILCFSLFKTSAVSKQIFNAH